jgi:ABC-2 type transport system ATP-binding protein/lipopolysaccharide transport system ATP-binding protein
MGTSIEIMNLSKRYRLGLTHRDLRETLTHMFDSALGRADDGSRKEFWALQDVSLSVDEGNAVGVIGRNGAGKSTLLKILARITEPTSGQSRTKGRVGALLEVGTGFHGELTGRENIFLNGAILGMPRRKVAARLDEIVEFSGVEPFIDTPVKRYSSGMFLRLAFSVAAHLDSEILVVDEVLAVGDAEFQRRCLGRMSEVEAEGRTVVFVSHDLNAVATLCDRVVWLDGGRVTRDGPTGEVLAQYLGSMSTGLDGPRRGSDSGVTLQRLEAVTVGTAQMFDRESPIRVGFEYRLVKPLNPFYACIQIHDTQGRMLIEERLPIDDSGRTGVYEGVMTLPPLLNVGRYEVSFWAGSQVHDYLFADRAIAFEVVGPDEERRKPVLRVHPEWQIRLTE